MKLVQKNRKHLSITVFSIFVVATATSTHCCWPWQSSHVETQNSFLQGQLAAAASEIQQLRQANAGLQQENKWLREQKKGLEWDIILIYKEIKNFGQKMGLVKLPHKR